MINCINFDIGAGYIIRTCVYLIIKCFEFIKLKQMLMSRIQKETFVFKITPGRKHLCETRAHFTIIWRKYQVSKYLNIIAEWVYLLHMEFFACLLSCSTSFFEKNAERIQTTRVDISYLKYNCAPLNNYNVHYNTHNHVPKFYNIYHDWSSKWK